MNDPIHARFVAAQCRKAAAIRPRQTVPMTGCTLGWKGWGVSTVATPMSARRQ